MIATGWGDLHVNEGDEILLTEMEHHANLVPWIMLAKRKNAILRHIPITDEGLLDLSKLDQLLTKRTKIVSLTHQSNVLGTINPVAEVAKRAHEVGAVVSVDGAQSVPHLPIQLEELDIDFLSFSSHKMLGPTGLGILWGKRELLESMEPIQGGGEMIKNVTLGQCNMETISPGSLKRERRISPISLLFSAAIDYLMELGMENIREHDIQLIHYAMDRLLSLGHITIYGPGPT